MLRSQFLVVIHQDPPPHPPTHQAPHVISPGNSFIPYSGSDDHGIGTVYAADANPQISAIFWVLILGGFIYEKNHIVIMAWGQSQRDIESIWTILRQVHPCACINTLVLKPYYLRWREIALGTGHMLWGLSFI